MKIKLKDLKQFIINYDSAIIVTAILMMAVFLFGNAIYTEYYEQKLCSEKLGIEYSIFNERVVAFYEYIDETHYNCCWDKVELTNEGYYTKRKCRGFVK